MAIVLPDPRFEMPELFVPGRKPTGPVKIDWGHHLAKHCVGFWLFNTASPVNLAKGRKLGNGASTIGTLEADHWVSPSGQIIGDELLTHDSIGTTTTDTQLPSSILTICSPEGAVSSYGTLGCTETIESGHYGFAVGFQSTTLMTYYKPAGGFTGTRSMTIPVDGTRLVITSSTDASNNHELICNGEVSDADAFDYWQFSPGVGADTAYANARGKWYGTHEAYAVFDVELSLAELKSLNSNPYQFLEPA